MRFFITVPTEALESRANIYCLDFMNTMLRKIGGFPPLAFCGFFVRSQRKCITQLKIKLALPDRYLIYLKPSDAHEKG